MKANINTREIGEKGNEIFTEITEELEEDYKGKFVAIEVDSGDYFIGDTSVEATKKAREKYPDRVFFVGRIGYRAAVSFKGGFYSKEAWRW